MKRLFKVIAVLLALLVIAALLAPQFISKDMVKAELIAQLKEKTGYSLSIGGDIGLGLFPHLRIDAADIALKDAKQAPLLEAKNLSVSVALLPLLQRQVELKKLAISGGSLGYDAGAKRWALTRIELTGAMRSLDTPIDVSGSASLGGRPIDYTLTLDSLLSFTQKQRATVTFSISDAELDAKGKGALGPTQYDGNIALTTAYTDAAGTLKADWSGAVPVLTAKLSTELLDLSLLTKSTPNAWMPALIADAYAAPAPWSSAPLDLSALKSVNANLTIDAGKVKAAGLSFDKATFKATLANALLKGSLQSAQFYQGALASDFSLDAKSPALQLQKRATLSGVDLASFLKDSAHTDRFTGKADLTLDVAATGRSEKELVETLRGNGSLRSPQGVIGGADLCAISRGMKAALASIRSGNHQSPYSALAASFTIAGGIVSNRDLGMTLECGKTTGAGTVNLPLHTVDYRLTPAFAVAVRNKDGSQRDDSIAAPIIITGALDAPEITVDFAAMIKDAISDERKYKQQGKAIKEEFKKINSPKDIGKLLKELGGQ